MEAIFILWCVGIPVLMLVGTGVTIYVFIRYAIPALRDWAKRRRKRRAGQWAQFAGSLGLEFSERDPFGILPRYSHPLLHQGRNRDLYHVMHGTYRGWQVKCFDYAYVVGSGKNQQTHAMTLLLVDAPLRFEPLELRPEHFGDRLGEVFGADDIDFESEAFSRKYSVRCRDRKFAYDLLHARAMEFLLGRHALAIQTHDNAVLFRYARQRLRLKIPYAVQALLDTGCEFMDLVPRYLVEARSEANDAPM